jgi:hypothetical protein
MVGGGGRRMAGLVGGGRRLGAENERRTSNIFGGSLMTSGSSAETHEEGHRVENDRGLSLFGGSLMTSESFTMMASTGACLPHHAARAGCE